MPASAGLVGLLKQRHGIFPKPDHLSVSKLIFNPESIFCFNHLLLVAVLFLFFKLFIREERSADRTNHLQWQNLVQGKSQRRRPKTNTNIVAESPNQLKT